MSSIEFTKMVASGNDFVVVDKSHKVIKLKSYKVLARKICDRKYGVGADGLLILEKSKRADVKMLIFNADGSEAEMCGNGARCVALLTGQKPEARNQKPKIETKAGIIDSRITGGKISIKLTDPKYIKLGMPINLTGRTLHVNFINTGVPHTVIFVEGLDKIDVARLGRQLRYHKTFRPKGTNVDFVEVLDNRSINLRTYERGVEDETLACGTGAVASALVTSFQLGERAINNIRVRTKGKEVLTVYFKNEGNKFRDIWLEGQARIVYKGCWCDE